MNILVYNGRGVSQEALHHTIKSLRHSLGHAYDIKLVTAEALHQQPWESNCSLLVLPGGRDLPYLNDLSGRASARITDYVRFKGGRLLGICAGAYFASSEVQFELGTPLEVRGPRELGLCSAVAKGTIYSGFQYNGDAGAHAVPLMIWHPPTRDALIAPTQKVRLYYNGGCWFDFGEEGKGWTCADLDYQIVGAYADRENKPGIIAGYQGGDPRAKVILSGAHIEYDAKEMSIRQPDHPLLPVLLESTAAREDLWNYILSLFGLASKTLSKGDQCLPEPTPLFMFFPESRTRTTFLAAIRRDDHFQDGVLKCEASRVRIIEGIPCDVPATSEEECPLIITDSAASFKEDTWSFSPDKYYLHLAAQPPVKGSNYVGRHLVYAEYINSTQTLLSR